MCSFNAQTIYHEIKKQAILTMHYAGQGSDPNKPALNHNSGRKMWWEYLDNGVRETMIDLENEIARDLDIGLTALGYCCDRCKDKFE